MRDTPVPPVLLLVASMCLGGGPADSSLGYADRIRTWQRDRDHRLRAPDGWLTLAGLFWLTPGRDQKIGSAPQADFSLAVKTTDPLIGTLHLSGATVTFAPAPHVAITMDGMPMHSPAVLRWDETNPDIVQCGSVSFFAISRGDRYGIRVRDSASPVLKSFSGLHYFPVKTEWRFTRARFIAAPKKIPILNVVGQTDLEESPGVVEFSRNATIYRLRPILEGDTLFFLFRDATNRTSTYQAGRMLNTPMPHDGVVDLDFNRAYNPPCTFTPYATCPLPPRENILPIAVEAGELRYGSGHPQ